MRRSVVLLLVLACAMLLAATATAGQQPTTNGPARDQVEQGVKHVKQTLKTIDAVNGGKKEPISQKKLRNLTAPKVEYYHEVQATVDKEVDATARAIIETPERVAYRKQVEADKKYAKTVSSAMATLKAHNALQPVKAPPQKN